MIQNLHTHSILSDGENSILDLALEAISKGFSSLGISDHSYLVGEDWCLKTDDLKDYLLEIEKVKNTVGDKLEIYSGLELDLLSDSPKEKLDFIIGSCHFVSLDKKAYCIDNSPRDFKKAIDAFGGINELTEAYYSQISGWAERKSDIVGHFDIIEKFISLSPELYLGVDKERILLAKEKAIKALTEADKIFEINTAGILKRNEIYPSKEVIKMLFELGAKITVTTDCHKKELLDFGYDETVGMLKNIGFEEIFVFSKEKFVPIKI